MSKPIGAVVLMLGLVAGQTLGGCNRGYRYQYAEDTPPEPWAQTQYPPETASPSDAVSFEAAAVPASSPHEAHPIVVEAANTYTIRRGDTLWSIAKQTYGDGHRWQDIAAANPGLDPTKLRIGQVIVLP